VWAVLRGLGPESGRKLKIGDSRLESDSSVVAVPSRLIESIFESLSYLSAAAFPSLLAGCKPEGVAAERGFCTSLAPLLDADRFPGREPTANVASGFKRLLTCMEL
jgi:hypothetical protein